MESVLRWDSSGAGGVVPLKGSCGMFAVQLVSSSGRGCVDLRFGLGARTEPILPRGLPRRYP